MRKYHRFHVKQKDGSDCGAACLLSVLKMYGGSTSLEKIREMSGTSSSGSTMLGLKEAALALSLLAEGYEATIEDLKSTTHPCILHIEKEGRYSHFIVCYQYLPTSREFLISDPANPTVEKLKVDDIDKLWKSKSLLLIRKTSEVSRDSSTSLKSRIKWILNFISDDLNLLFSSLVLGLMIALLSLSVAIFSQQLIDSILPQKDLMKLISAAGLLLFLLLLKSGLSYIRQLFLINQKLDFNIRILDFFYSKLLYLPKSFFDTRKTGDMVARMNDTARVQEVVSLVFSQLAIDLLMVVVSITAIFIYNTSVGFISLIWIPFFVLLVWLYKGRIVKSQKAVMVSYAMNESNYIDTIQGINTIKAEGKEPYFSRVTKHFYTFFQIAKNKLGKVGLSFSIVTAITGSVFLVVVLTFSAHKVILGLLSVGAVIAILQLISSVMGSVTSMTSAYIRLREAQIALERMWDFTDLDSEFDEETESTRVELDKFRSLKVNNLKFRFIGRPLLLNGVDFELNAGEMIAILGKNGSGKSTLLQILSRYYPIESGDIFINDLPLEVYNVTSLRKLLGIVPQKIKIFSRTLGENILLSEPSEDDLNEIQTFLDSMGFSAHFESLPAGLETVVGENGINLSGGQEQMLAIARTIYQKPGLILLDEGTSSMDAITERRVMDSLKKRKNQSPIIFVTHNALTASMADRIYILENGKISEAGTHDELINRSNFYSDSYNAMQWSQP